MGTASFITIPGYRTDPVLQIEKSNWANTYLTSVELKLNQTMEVRDYISSGERVLAEVDTNDDPYALFFSGVDGTLVCTEQRMVYVSGKQVTDISINRVDSFQYHAPTMPRAYVYSGIGAFVIAIFDVYPDITLLAYVVGVVLIATAYWFRTSTLSLHTPSESYEFQSRDNDLVEIAHVLRERESVNTE